MTGKTVAVEQYDTIGMETNVHKHKKSVMSLQVCSTDRIDASVWSLWAPYAGSVPLAGFTRDTLLTPLTAAQQTACASVCAPSQPESSSALRTCAECLIVSSGEAVEPYYGCTYCQSVLAKVAAYADSQDAGSGWTYADLQAYLDNTDGGRAAAVDGVWSGLSECQRGQWVKWTCLRENAPGLPYQAGGSSGDGLDSGGGAGGVNGLVVALAVLGILFIVGMAAWLSMRGLKEGSGAWINTWRNFLKSKSSARPVSIEMSNMAADRQQLPPPSRRPTKAEREETESRFLVTE